MSQGRTTGVHRIEFDVDWPPGHVACYLLPGEEPLLVDAGTPEDEARLADGLAAVGLDLAEVEHLLVTHPHQDHVGCVQAVVDAADPVVYAPVGVAARFAQDPEAVAARVRTNTGLAGITGERQAEAVRMAVTSLERNASLLPTDLVDVWVEGGQPVEVGSHTVEPVHTPGHQADHLCYLLGDEERALLAGDMAIATFRSVLLHDGLDDGVTEAVDAYRTALDRLGGLEVDRVYPGHGPGHEDLPGAVDMARDSLEGLLDRTVSALEDGVETVPGVAAAIAADRPMRYMVLEATSALAHLHTTGRVDRSTVDGVHHYRPA